MHVRPALLCYEAGLRAKVIPQVRIAMAYLGISLKQEPSNPLRCGALIYGIYILIFYPLDLPLLSALLHQRSRSCSASNPTTHRP